MSKRNLAVVPDVELDEAGLVPDESGDLTVTGAPRCKGVKDDGTRCGSFRGRSGFCFNHDPNIDRTTKRATRASGGRASSKAARAQRMLPPRLRGVFEKLTGAMDDVIDGTLSPNRATALASLASASVRVLESGEMEERLRRMEAATEGGEDDDPTPGVSDGG